MEIKNFGKKNKLMKKLYKEEQWLGKIEIIGIDNNKLMDNMMEDMKICNMDKKLLCKE